MTTKIYEDETSAFYSVSPKVNVSLKMNFTFSDMVYINTYIPAFDDLAIDEFVYRLTVAGVATKIGDIKENSEIVVIDGQQYYKVVSPIEYSRITDKVIVTVGVANRSKTGITFSVTKRVNFAELMTGYLDDPGIGSGVGEVLYFVYQNAQNPGAIPDIRAVVTERFAARIAEDARKAEESEKESEGFFDKIFGIFR